MNTAQENDRIRSAILAFVRSNYDHAQTAFSKAPSAANFAALDEAMWSLQAMHSVTSSDIAILRTLWSGPASQIIPTLAATHRQSGEEL